MATCLSIHTSSISGKLSLIKHGNGFSVFGDAKEIYLDGTIDKDKIFGRGYVPNTQIQAKVVLTKIKELEF